MSRHALLLVVSGFVSCASVPVYPSRPSAAVATPTPDPAPAKLVVHLAATSEGLTKALDVAVPSSGETSFELRGPRTVKWTRGALALRFGDGKVQVQTDLTLETELPLLGRLQVPVHVTVAGEPIISSDWHAKLQSPVVQVESKDLRLRTAEGLGGALKSANVTLEKFLEGFSYDLGPQVKQAYQRVALPIELPVGDAKGCAALKVTSIEAGPTVLAGGVEKDLAVVVAPSVSLPCNAGELPPEPPPLANVATLPSGPFTVTVPIAASYAELAKAMSLTFTDGKLYFSKSFPKLYLEKPELYASTKDELVLKVHLAGPVAAAGLNADLDGDLYFAGHPQVVDNEVRIPDLEPTVDTSSFLLALKANLDASGIRDQARNALRLDLGDRLGAVRARLSSDFGLGGEGLGCLRTQVDKIEVTGVFPHAQYLRVYVTVTAQAGVYLPCPGHTAPATSSLAEPPRG